MPPGEHTCQVGVPQPHPALIFKYAPCGLPAIERLTDDDGVDRWVCARHAIRIRANIRLLRLADTTITIPTKGGYPND